MRITWIDGEKEVPGIGVLMPGDERDVPPDLGQALVRQKQAKEVRRKKKADSGHLMDVEQGTTDEGGED